MRAHGIDEQDDLGDGSRITDGDLVEGGQLLFLVRDDDDEGDDDDDDNDDDEDGDD